MTDADLKANLFINYVFQNKFKDYFSDDIIKVLDIIQQEFPHQNRNKNTDKKFRCENFKLDGTFNTKNRSLSFPNLFSYGYAISGMDFNAINNFGKIGEEKNLMKIDYKNRKFKSNSFTESLEVKINLLLTKFDRVYKIDIQSFYSSIYTHVFEKISNNQLKDLDKNIRLFNNKKTNQLLLGNLFSTFSANEIMHYLSTNIEKKLKEKYSNIEVKYFSDQFYIFYNFNEFIEADIKKVTQEILDTPYFEYKINYSDSIISKHEELVEQREFTRKTDDIFSVFYMRKLDFKNRPYTEVLKENEEKIIHFVNSLIENYYVISDKKRESFVSVVFKKTFSSSVNLYRLYLIFDRSDNEKRKSVLNILMFFLKQHPSLVIEYIKIGLFDVASEFIFNRSYDSERKQLMEYFYDKLNANSEKLDSIYYWHIFYKLCSNESEKSKAKNFYKNDKCNDLLKALIIENFNLKLSSRSEAKRVNLQEKEWLLNYTKINQHSRIMLDEATAINNIANECLRNNIKILNKFDYIVYEPEKKVIFDNVKNILNAWIYNLENPSEESDMCVDLDFL